MKNRLFDFCKLGHFCVFFMVSVINLLSRNFKFVLFPTNYSTLIFFENKYSRQFYFRVTDIIANIAKIELPQNISRLTVYKQIQNFCNTSLEKTSLQRVYGRHHELVDRYGVSICAKKTDLFNVS